MSNLHLSAPSSHLTVSSPMGGKRRWHIKTVATIITTLLTTVLVACGGDGAAGPVAVAPSVPPSTTCAPFSDSFDRSVTCEQMRALAGASEPYVDSGGDASSGAGDAGADGTAADGAAIANMDIRFEDITGRKITTRTDANGYYRINLRGMKAPLVVSVLRDGNPWKSMLVEDIVRAPANRRFYTINLTGLTDVVASQVAKKEGLSGADALTPAVVSRQKGEVNGVVAGLNNGIAAQITAAGMSTSTFNPLSTAFVPDRTGYDKVLETTIIVRTPSGETVLVNTAFRFEVNDQWTYTGISATSTISLSNTITVLTTSGGKIASRERKWSDGRLSRVGFFDSETRYVRDVISDGAVCDFSPPAIYEYSDAVAKLSISQSVTGTSTWSCVDPTGVAVAPQAYSATFRMIGFEDVSTAAGLFKNTRIIETMDNISGTKSYAWMDPVMNRAVRFRSVTIAFGIEVTSSTSELTSFSVKNYPRSP
jgi:hypothetical protein